jgi:hypothetical protein
MFLMVKEKVWTSRDKVSRGELQFCLISFPALLLLQCCIDRRLKVCNNLLRFIFKVSILKGIYSTES